MDDLDVEALAATLGRFHSAALKAGLPENIAGVLTVDVNKTLLDADELPTDPDAQVSELEQAAAEKRRRRAEELNE